MSIASSVKSSITTSANSVEADEYSMFGALIENEIPEFPAELLPYHQIGITKSEAAAEAEQIFILWLRQELIGTPMFPKLSSDTELACKSPEMMDSFFPEFADEDDFRRRDAQGVIIDPEEDVSGNIELQRMDQVARINIARAKRECSSCIYRVNCLAASIAGATDEGVTFTEGGRREHSTVADEIGGTVEPVMKIKTTTDENGNQIKYEAEDVAVFTLGAGVSGLGTQAHEGVWGGWNATLNPYDNRWYGPRAQISIPVQNLKESYTKGRKVMAGEKVATSGAIPMTREEVIRFERIARMTEDPQPKVLFTSISVRG